ncbi:hypothetical protein BC835DRAFT_156014 [Cytidiella melzeri]|nr:hypothetical protein BC835DRAFT_156014 [Cytidiella melzeri]
MSSHTSVSAAVPHAQAYPFLAQPPLLQDAPSFAQSGNARRRSLAAINNWATNVQPGPPAPLTPNKTAFSDAPHSSKHARRYSSQVAPPVVPPTPVDYLPESPTSSEGTVAAAMKPDLQAIGYTSVFVQLPSTPPANVDITPDGRTCTPVDDLENTRSGSSKRRFKSLSIKPHSRSKSVAAPLPSPKTYTSVTKDKKSKYADARPAMLAQELAFAQFMGGGKVEHHMKQSAEKQAKKAGAVKGKNGQLVGVAPVWQDGQGGIWRDQQEEEEYTHLLGGSSERNASTRHADWVQFDERRGVGVGRQGRRGSVSTVDSDLDPHRTSSRSQHLRNAPNFNADVFAAGPQKSRRRPEPLDLVAPHDTEDVRRDFLQSSFAPVPLRRVDTMPTEGSSSRKSVMSNVKGMFKSKKSKPS